MARANRNRPRLRAVPPPPAIAADPPAPEPLSVTAPPDLLADLLARQADAGQAYLRSISSTHPLPPTTCPGCGQQGTFRVSNSYHTRQGRRRLRKCCECGHAQSETVANPITDSEE